ncbi:MAG: M10 family metallopeptidase C-terminal domain-containing protein [Candidatus Phlomobacter fragariae]
MDFQSGQDKIDLSCLNKNLYDNSRGQGSFIFIDKFSRKPGEIKIIYYSGSKQSKVQLNIDNYDIAEFAIDIYDYIDPVTDFILNK